MLMMLAVRWRLGTKEGQLMLMMLAVWRMMLACLAGLGKKARAADAHDAGRLVGLGKK